MRRTHRLLLLLLTISLIGCPDTSQDGPSTSFVLRPEEIPGESKLLRAEDDRKPDASELRSSLRSSNPLVRGRGALSIGRHGLRTLSSDLATLFVDREASVRASAAQAAGFLTDPELLEGVEALLADPDVEVRAAALRARSMFGGALVPDAVTKLLEPNPEAPQAAQLQGAACLAVSRFSDPSVAPRVAELVGHADPEVRWRAVWALGRMGQDAYTLINALADTDPRVRALAALGLGAMRSRDAVPSLIAFLEDPDTGVAAAAASALGDIGDDRSSEALGKKAESPVPRVRLAAIDAMARSGQGAQKARQLLDDPSSWVRAKAVTALSRTKVGNDLFRRLSKDDDWRVRARAATALAARGDVETLNKEMQYDPDVRVIPSVLEGLATLNHPDLTTILAKHLTDKDATVRATAARLLIRRDQLTAVDLLAGSYDSSKHDDGIEGKMAIITALGDAPRTDRQLNTIKQAALDQDWVLRTRAFSILERLGEVGGIAPPDRVGTLRTESYYRDLVGRGDFEYRATFTTDKGNVVFRLYPKIAPLTVAFLEDMANSGYYLDQPLTEMSPAREIGGGDDRGDGRGRFEGWVRDEPHGKEFDQPQIYMRRLYGRDSGCSQFRFTYLPRPELESEATVFGELMSDRAVLDQLVPEDVIRNVAITSHEFRGNIVRERVRVDEPTEVATAPDAEGTQDGDQATARRPPSGPQKTARPWVRSSAVLAMCALAVVVLFGGLVPMLSSSFYKPPALWVVVGIIVLITGTYLVLIFTGGYYGLLTHEAPGPRFMGKPNPPILADHEAHMVILCVLGFIVFQYALLYLLTSGKTIGRWLFMFLALIEGAAFAAQLKLGLTVIYVISDVAMVLNAAKVWFLLMDKGIRQNFRGAPVDEIDDDDDDDDDVNEEDDFE